MALGQPEGGGNLYPLSIFSIAWFIQTVKLYDYILMYVAIASIVQILSTVCSKVEKCCFRLLIF